MGIVNEDDLPPACPFCKNTSRLSPNPNGGMREIKILEGPFFSYRRREKELYFDLEKKYAKCSSCGEELEIVDFQVMLELLASMLPPESARRFTKKNMDLFEESPGKMKEVIQLLFREFEEGMEFLDLEDDDSSDR
jgi:hypothetical protein